MLERMSCQCRMVYFDIQFEIFIQSMLSQKANYRSCIVIILMLGRLHRLRLDEECSFETILSSIVPCYSKELSKMLSLTLHICIEQRHIAFTTSPEHIILTI